jgi:hypothetical protein
VTQFEAKALEDELRAQLRAELRAFQATRRRPRPGGLLARLRRAVAPVRAAQYAEDA